MPAIEIPPLTEQHRQAIRACRFATTNIERSLAWAWSDDDETVRVLVPGVGLNAAERLAAGADQHPSVAAATRYRRSVEPEKYEWELHFTHPDAVAFIGDLVDERRG